MQCTTTALLAFIASLAAAAPVKNAQRAGFEAQITFYGAADAQFTMSVPTDGSVFYVGKSHSFLRTHSLSPSCVPLNSNAK